MYMVLHGGLVVTALRLTALVVLGPGSTTMAPAMQGVQEIQDQAAGFKYLCLNIMCILCWQIASLRQQHDS